MNWIESKSFDLTFIFFPGILSVVFVVLGNELNFFPSEIGNWSWLILVVGIDVCHVWATIFRTYLNKFSLKEFEKELIIAPLFLWVLACVIYSIDSLYFWRILAYFAVFHFVKQQIGLLRIYTRKENKKSFEYRFDEAFLYVLTLIPVVIWHFISRSFYWFIKGDFVELTSFFSVKFFYLIYIIFILSFISKEIYFFFKRKKINFQKNMLLLSTGLVWYVGILYYNNDYSFTITNIIHHGVPYFALIWVSSLKNEFTTSLKKIAPLFKNVSYKFLFFVIILLALGLLEEYFWDIFVWHERKDLFFFTEFIELDFRNLSWVIPLLSVPQMTHYYLDGIIWKSDRKISEFKF